MKRSEFRSLINECVLDALLNNKEVQSMVMEMVQAQAGVLVEAVQQKQSALPMEPADPELYDKLMIVAAGRSAGMKHNGKRVKAPNHGNGFKSGKMIKEWTEKVYNKVGGDWVDPSPKPQNRGNIAALQSLMGSVIEGEGGTQLVNTAASGNDNALREEIQRAGLGTSRTSLASDDQSRIDITDLLMDTAKTTLIEQDAKSGIGPVSDAASMTVATSTPEELFGEAASGWANMAFDN